MAIEALLGGAVGLVGRLMPEALKFFDRKSERAHELALGDQQQKLVAIQGNSQLQSVSVQAQANQFTQAVAALQEAYKTQAPTGNKIVDFVNSTVRPIVTYGFSLAYLYTKMVTGHWDETDTAIFSAILNFWFMGRVFDKATK